MERFLLNLPGKTKEYGIQNIHDIIFASDNSQTDCWPGILSEGFQKFIIPDTVGAGRFEKIGFENPEFWAFFTGAVEIICGILLLIGFLTRLASVPLLIIMLIAFAMTKYPVLLEKGFLPMAHEYRTDFAMTMLLVFLLYYGGGSHSLDRKFFGS